MTKLNKFESAPCGFALIIFAIAGVLGMSVAGCAQTSPYVVAASAAAVDSSSAAAFPASSDAADEPILAITNCVYEVNVLFIATDGHGKFVRNLNQNAFSIFDYDKRVQSIFISRRETYLPI